MERIKLAGRRLRWIVGALLIVAPFAFFGVFAWQGPATMLGIPADAAAGLDGASVLDAVVLAALAALGPLVYWLAFWALFRLTACYARGAVFRPEAVWRLRQFGWLLVATDLVRMVQTALTGPIVTLLGLGGGFVHVELKLSMSVIGLVIVLIARIMEQAAALEDEQRLTV